MTPLPVFPMLPGQAWSVHKRPLFSTRVVSHASGREVRSPDYNNPLYEWELTFDGLSANNLGGLGAGSLQTLMGFVLACQGQYGTFLYTDPSDNMVRGQPIAIGDGNTTSFALVRSLGGFTEPVGWATSVTNVRVGGAPATSATTLTQPNTLGFASAPAAGAVIAADISFGFLCRFTEDAQDFENIMAGLWQLRTLKFRSVRTS